MDKIKFKFFNNNLSKVIMKLKSIIFKIKVLNQIIKLIALNNKKFKIQNNQIISLWNRMIKALKYWKIH